MSEAENQAAKIPANAIVIQSRLSPADATNARDDVVKALDAADGSIDISLDDDSVTPCGMQLLIAACNGARKRGLETSMPPATIAVLSSAGVADL